MIMAKFTDQQITEMMAQIKALTEANELMKAKLAQGKKVSPLSDPAYRAECLRVKPLLAKYCMDTYKVELAHVFTSTDKVLPEYRNPVTGETWASRGKMPSWLKGHEDQYKVPVAVNGAAH